jgi:dinuclear metal center YbgI/SA1388 family protein
MTLLADIDLFLESIAPRRLAQSWDNVGLLMGDPRATIHKVMTCLTVTPETAAEAIAGSAELIVSHHPILFKATRTLRGDRAETEAVWRLASAGVAVISPHTAFDDAPGGINELLAEKIGLLKVGPLRTSTDIHSLDFLKYKIVVFTPRSDLERVSAAAFAAGAGTIGGYSECSFSTSGVGTFLGDESTNPTVGRKGRREHVRERKLEFVCPADRIGEVVQAVRTSHSYEEPAIDVYPLADDKSRRDDRPSGRIGELKAPESLGDFAKRIALELKSNQLMFTGTPERSIKRVAIACGAGDDFLGDAARSAADVLLTGEARYHRAVESETLGIALITAGHHATERPGVENLAARIAAAFPNLSVWASRHEHDPLRSVDFAEIKTNRHKNT